MNKVEKAVRLSCAADGTGIRRSNDETRRARKTRSVTASLRWGIRLLGRVFTVAPPSVFTDVPLER
jgi:hypothetical protein